MLSRTIKRLTQFERFIGKTKWRVAEYQSLIMSMTAIVEYHVNMTEDEQQLARKHHQEFWDATSKSLGAAPKGLRYCTYWHWHGQPLKQTGMKNVDESTNIALRVITGHVSAFDLCCQRTTKMGSKVVIAENRQFLKILEIVSTPTWAGRVYRLGGSSKNFYKSKNPSVLRLVVYRFHTSLEYTTNRLG